MPQIQIFKHLRDHGRVVGLTPSPSQSRESRDWFRKAAQKVKEVDVHAMLNEAPSRMQYRLGPQNIGDMVLMSYDALHKDKLPYWDQQPLILPFSFSKNLFTSYNLHYLPPARRAYILNQMLKISEKYDNKYQKLNVSYQTLKAMSQFADLKGCIHSYLYSQVRSRYLIINPNEWYMSVGLPTARFTGGVPQRTIHSNTRKQKWKH